MRGLYTGAGGVPIFFRHRVCPIGPLRRKAVGAVKQPPSPLGFYGGQARWGDEDVWEVGENEVSEVGGGRGVGGGRRM